MKDISLLSIAIGVGLIYVLKSADSDASSAIGSPSDTMGSLEPTSCCALRKGWFCARGTCVYLAYGPCGEAGTLGFWMDAIEGPNASPYCFPDGSIIDPPLQL